MKWAATSLLLAAATATAQEQQVLGNTVPGSAEKAANRLADSLPIQKLKESVSKLSAETQALWDDITLNFPETVDQSNFISSAKPHTRKHDSEWDHIMRGEDISSLWTTDSDGEQEREIDGKLAQYDLRTKVVDPSELGVDTVKQYSGYLDDNEEDKHLFYWFFESRNDPKNDPVILWLNGGPGCSSLTGLFLELGPSFVNKKLGLDYNPFSWNANASVIFLDQPVNVGYSYSGGSVSNTVAAGKDVYALMTLFFKQFPQYAHQDFHIAGESYAGHYIPQFATEILAHKKNNINLKSVMIGNGLTDGLTQYEYYRPMACGDSPWPAVLDESQCRAMDNALPRCQSLIQSCYDSESVWTCVPAAIYCNNAMLSPYQQSGQNVYDIRGKCTGGSLCYDALDWIAEYLNSKKAMKALGAEVSSYDSCNMDINRNFLFAGDWMKPFHRVVPALLEKIPVLIYAGDADFICNYLGNMAWMEALEWPGKKAYNAEKLAPLKQKSDNQQTGFFKSSGNFTFMQIHAAGHMVPMDQPEAALDMVNRWLSGEFLE